MIFIIGVTPKTRVLEKSPGICTRCGLAQAQIKRIDHYLSLFFIPLFRVKKGDPVIVCEQCEQRMDQGAWDFFRDEKVSDALCPHCNRTISDNFRYCPYCGKQV